MNKEWTHRLYIFYTDIPNPLKLIWNAAEHPDNMTCGLLKRHFRGLFQMRNFLGQSGYLDCNSWAVVRFSIS